MEYKRIRLLPANDRQGTGWKRQAVKQRRGKVRQRRVPSKAALGLMRFRLKQQRMEPLPRRKDLEQLAKEAEQQLRRNARLLDVED